jgi:hypothetical protein
MGHREIEKKNYLEMRVEPRTFIMHRLTLYQLSYIHN